MMESHLESSFTEPFRDPVWGDIMLSPQFKNLTSTAAFQKLAGIKQLGPSYLVYPGAVHTRLLHSIGVFHLAWRLLRQLSRSSGAPRLEKEEIDIFLAAALFHDLGHFPFAHSLKELSLRDHEELTGEIINSPALSGAIRRELGVEPDLIALVIDESRPLPAGSAGERIGWFRTLLSGVLDPDKLDYLNRDAFFCGIPYGYQDVDNILARTVILPSGRVGVDQAGTSAVENLLFSKYLMYRTVYWHRTVRIATAMIKQALLHAFGENILTPGDLYGIDDASFFRKISSIDYRPFSLVADVQDRNLFKMVLEVDYRHLPSLDIENRLASSDRAAGRLSSQLGTTVYPWQIIADIPEPISFETDLGVLTSGGPKAFAVSGTVFSGAVVTGFSRSLRKLRLFADPQLAGTLENYEQESLLELFV
jgi:HD superfamily phosphohydrolase